MKLIPEMIPTTSFFTNLRSMLTQSEWDIIRRRVYKKAEYKCEICGGKGTKHPVECHEIWKFIKWRKIQKLIGFKALCPSCHECIHIGLAWIRGHRQRALNHLIKVNNISRLQAEELITDAFELWKERSQIEWKLDIKLIKGGPING